jgi:ABC-type branched-subunit amino acid transport system permease subunit
LTHAVGAGRVVLTLRDRKHRALIGGAIGAAAGLLACTAVSTLANDSADGGLSFCPLDSYLLIGGAGAVLGATIGWAI